jgi:inner membrane protease subunit 2
MSIPASNLIEMQAHVIAYLIDTISIRLASSFDIIFANLPLQYLQLLGMPPRPPTRIPVKSAPAARRQPPPLHISKPLSQPSPKPHVPPHTPSPPRTQWYRNPKLRYSTLWGFRSVVGMCGIFWVRDNYMSFDCVSGASMAPTMNPRTHETGQRDWIFVRPYLRRRLQNNGDTYGIKRGDVVTFWKPHKPEEIAIKRVVALEGDVVYPKSGYVLETDNAPERLNGMPDGLPDDNDPDSIASERREAGRIVVPYGHVWVEGDNWRESLDSRHYGPITKGLVLGKAVGIWRSWGDLLGVGDERSVKEKRMASRVVEGKAEIPVLFLD